MQYHTVVLDSILSHQIIKVHHAHSGQVAQLVRMSSPCAKAAALIPSQGTYKRQP